MDAEGHYSTYLYAWLIYGFFMALNDAFDLWFFCALFAAFFAVNPDYFDQALALHKKNQHRCFFSHSVLYPIAAYWVFHPWLNIALGFQIGVIMFYPVGVHLICDFVLIKSTKEPNPNAVAQGTETANQPPKELVGYATIKVFNCNLKRKGSLWYIFLNIGAIICYMIWAL